MDSRGGVFAVSNIGLTKFMVDPACGTQQLSKSAQLLDCLIA